MLGELGELDATVEHSFETKYAVWSVTRLLTTACAHAPGSPTYIYRYIYIYIYAYIYKTCSILSC